MNTPDPRTAQQRTYDEGEWDNRHCGAPTKSGKRCRAMVGQDLKQRLTPRAAAPRTSRTTPKEANSGGFLTASPPSKKATARQDQAGQSGTYDGTGNWCGIGRDDARKVARGRIVIMEERRIADK
jgi:hypothetical protein